MLIAFWNFASFEELKFVSFYRQHSTLRGCFPMKLDNKSPDFKANNHYSPIFVSSEIALLILFLTLSGVISVYVLYQSMILIGFI